MARITFNPNQPIQSLSGTLGRDTFRTLNGRTYVHQRPEPVLPKNPTPQQRAAIRRKTIINHCITDIQRQYSDIRDAIAMRSKIKDRVEYLYDKFVTNIKAPTKLQKEILSKYYRKFSPTSPNHSRGNPDPIPSQSRPVLCSKTVTFARVQS